MSEALKTNTTLTQLDMSGDDEKGKEKKIKKQNSMS